MNKPEKIIDCRIEKGQVVKTDSHIWNKCCDQWEAFLPSVDEIEEIINNVHRDVLRDGDNGFFSQISRVSDAIHQRIKGSKDE